MKPEMMTAEELSDQINDFCWSKNCDDCPLYKICKENGGFSEVTPHDILEKAIHIIRDKKSPDEVQAKPEAVNHPNHYQGAHECIDVMRAMFGDEAVKGFCRCNAFKYRFRADKKNGAEDIKKAEWYEDYLIKMEESE